MPDQLWSLCFRGIALTLCVALGSLWTQLDAFGGTRGLQPIAVKFRRIQLHRRHAWLATPSVLWIACGDAALHGWVALGIAAALRAVWGGSGARTAILIANLIYLSFDPVFGLSMPWDCLLLEAGWLAPLLPSPSPPVSLAAMFDAEPVHPVAAFLVRWLLFRLMIGFGKLKFRGTSASDALYVRDFMILQPMPSRLGWLVHCHLPRPVFRLLLKGMFVTEILAPWLLLLPLQHDAPCQLAAALFLVCNHRLEPGQRAAAVWPSMPTHTHILAGIDGGHLRARLLWPLQHADCLPRHPTPTARRVAAPPRRR